MTRRPELRATHLTATTGTTGPIPRIKFSSSTREGRTRANAWPSTSASVMALLSPVPFWWLPTFWSLPTPWIQTTFQSKPTSWSPAPPWSKPICSFGTSYMKRQAKRHTSQYEGNIYDTTSQNFTVSECTVLDMVLGVPKFSSCNVWPPIPRSNHCSMASFIYGIHQEHNVYTHKHNIFFWLFSIHCSVL